VSETQAKEESAPSVQEDAGFQEDDTPVEQSGPEPKEESQPAQPSESDSKVSDEQEASGS
jgi:hypothetical protein